MHRRSSQDGAVTAETAVVLPMIAIFAVGLAWLVSLGVVQVRVQDAAREAARVAARGDSVVTATSYARRIAPAGARVTIARSGGSVVVTVEAPVDGPGGFFRFLPDYTVRARSVAALEGGVGAAGGAGP
jgi:Flp pilus assembly protein TadG